MRNLHSDEFKQQDLRLMEEGREIVFKGLLSKRDGDLQVYLFDHAILFTKPSKNKQSEQYRVYRKVKGIDPLSILPPLTFDSRYPWNCCAFLLPKTYHRRMVGEIDSS